LINKRSLKYLFKKILKRKDFSNSINFLNPKGKI